jgi:hypothetical protein
VVSPASAAAAASASLLGALSAVMAEGCSLRLASGVGPGLTTKT